MTLTPYVLDENGEPRPPKLSAAVLDALEAHRPTQPMPTTPQNNTAEPKSGPPARNGAPPQCGSAQTGASAPAASQELPPSAAESATHAAESASDGAVTLEPYDTTMPQRFWSRFR